MAIKAISQFDAATPTSNDKILFEQNGEGKSTTLADLPVFTKTQTALNTKVNTANVLSLEELMAATTFTGKVANASITRDLKDYKYEFYQLNNPEDARGIYGVGSDILTEGNSYNAYLVFNIAWITLRFKITVSGVYVSYKYGDNNYTTPVKIA